MSGNGNKNGKVNQFLERIFYSWGCIVASNPWKVIAATLFVTGLGSLGLFNFSAETNAWKMLLPEGSRYWKNQEWKNSHFVEDTRATITILTHEENVLTPEAMLLLLDLHDKVMEATFEGGDYTRACMKIPITNILLERRRRSALETNATLQTSASREYAEFDDYFNFYGTEESDGDEATKNGDDQLEGLPRDIYCDVIETLDDKCGEYSLLEIWKYDREEISRLSEQDIINAINTVSESPVFGYKTNYVNYLGQVERNSTGQVVGAHSIRTIWLESFKPEDIPSSNGITGIQLDLVDPFTLGYEQEVLTILKAWRDEREKEGNGYHLYMNLGLSFSTEAGGPIKYDINRQILGYVLMFTYTMLSLGNLNIVESKFFLAAAGILSVFFGVVVGIGLTMALGLPYTPTTGILPFICLGIGIDDMFVIVRCLNNIPEERRRSNSSVTNIGLAMKHAGASITVTSVTDIFAFVTGAITFFPSLQSLCISAAISIGTIYLFQVSWFVAWMVLDLKRIDQKRNSLLPFIIHKDWLPPKWSREDIITITTSKLSGLFRFSAFRAFIILLTTVLLSIGIWGLSQISLGYPGVDLVPEDSYFKAWFHQNEIDFPSDGFGVNFYTQEVSYEMEDFEKIERIVNELDNLTKTHNEWVHYGKDLPKAVQTPFEASTGFWWLDFEKFLHKQKDIQDWRKAFTSGLFPTHLSDFLHHKDGAGYMKNFRFTDDLNCGAGAPSISAMKLGTLKIRYLEGLGEIIPAQKAINDILSNANLSSETLADGYVYPAWEIVEILGKELYRNIAIALACVLVIIYITMADLRACLFTLACVVFTLVDVVGIIYALGMKIEHATLYCFVIGIGLSVDYGAHIAHAFLVTRGTSSQRATDGFASISPAILHGGISTFLAITPIAFSQSHVFTTFFRMISLLVAFGLFHGLFFLPVLLSIFGGDNLKDGDEDEGPPQVANKVSYGLHEINSNIGVGSTNPGFQEDASA